MMGRLLWLPAKLAEWGVPFQVTPGWESRGTSDNTAQVVVGHHDAIRSTLAGASIVAMMVNGRPDLSGPLCNLWIDDDYDLTREPGDPMVYVIASGTSHNAGEGSWRGISGNHNTIGIEARNNGIGEAWSARMIDIYQRTSAACLVGIGQTADRWCRHAEWAPTRKIDPAGIDGPTFRTAVGKLLAAGPTPDTPQENDHVVTLAATSAHPPLAARPNAYYACEGLERSYLTGAALAAWKSIGATDLGINDVFVALHPVNVADTKMPGDA